MATIDVVDTGNKKAGSLELVPSVFEQRVRVDLFHTEVRRQLGARRAGTHSSKNRAAVAGGGAKPYRQKGTGRARQGTIRAPQFQGGGAVFGPVPRNYDYRSPKKVRRKALCSALSEQFGKGAITVVDALEMTEFKTKRMVEVLEGLGLAGTKVLIVTSGPDTKLERSVRNLPGVSVVRSEGLNVYDVLRHAALLFTKEAFEEAQARLAGKSKGASA